MLAAFVAVVALIVGGCGKESASQTSAPTGTPSKFPVTLQTASGSTTLPAAPTRIVSLSPTATEMLFAIHAGTQVIAVDDQSNYPPQAPKTKLSGFQPNIEAIAAYKPDLVVFADDTHKLAASLKTLSIPALSEPAAKTLDDTYSQIAQLGVATGRTADASDLIASMRADVRGILSDVPKFKTAPTYYHELDNTYFTATSKSFIGQLYGLLGLRNIADPADKTGSGYPQLSAEFIVRTDPQLIFLADTKCCKQSELTLSKRPGWDKIAAVKNHNVVELDDDIASRWGPRVVDFLRTAAKSLRDAKALPS